MKKILLFLSIILLIAGCASKRYTKKAAKFEEAGLYEDAAAYYYEAIKKKDSNVDAKLGLRKTGQQTLDKKLSEFNIAYKQADYKKAVYNFIDAENYYNKTKAVHVELNFPEYYREYYEESKNDYLNKKYTDGVDKLNRDDFAAAILVFDEIKKIDANYKDVKDLYITAKYEPLYRDANQYLDNNLYRKAYYTFENILNGTGGYKQSSTLKEEALEKGTITILVAEFQYSNNYTRNTSQVVTSKVRSLLSTSENPFIKVIDVSAVNANIYQDGRLNMKAANLSGIKSILTGNIVRVVENTGKLNKTEKRGYIKVVKKVRNDKGEEVEKVEYNKTTYYEYKAENYASIELNFKLISTENNEILVSDLISLTNNDEMHYATYSGEKKTLVPGYWKYQDRKSSEDNIKDNQSDINKLKNLLGASKDIKSTTELLDEVIKQSVQRITDKVNKYNPEK